MDLSASPIVQLSQARLSYPTPTGEIEVLTGIDLSVFPGEIVAVTGPSGSGKSSLIAVIGGLEPLSGGQAQVLQTNMAVESERGRTLLRRRDIGIVFQAYHLVPSMTALQNAALPLTLAGRPDAQEKAADMLERVGLGHRLTHRPSALSGGEQQRVAIVRGIANVPRVLLADEPTGNLDPQTAADVFAQLTRIVRGTGLSALIATHNLDLAAEMDRAVELSNGVLVERRL